MTSGTVRFPMQVTVEYLCSSGHRQEVSYGFLEERKETIVCPCGEEAVRQGTPVARKKQFSESWDSIATREYESIAKHGMNHWNRGESEKFVPRRSDPSITMEALFGRQKEVGGT